MKNLLSHPSVELKRLFILSNPRSGSSLLRLMLNRHAQVIVPPESGFALWLYSEFGSWQQEDCFKDRLKIFLKKLGETRKFKTWDLSLDRLKLQIEKEQPANYGDLIACVYQAFSPTKKDAIIVDKNNYYVHHLDTLAQLWPDAGFIHLIRDGRDVACSYLELKKLKSNSPYKPNLSNSLPNIASEWQENNLAIQSFVRNRMHVQVSFEDLVLKPRRTLEDLVAFIGVPFDADMFSFFKQERKEFSEPKETLDWKMKTQEPLDKTRIGRYIEGLTAEQGAVFEKNASLALKQFNYE